jgi:DNA gyrase subunit B
MTELFIVEGDFSRWFCKVGTRSLDPSRITNAWQILNVERVQEQKALSSETIKSLITASDRCRSEFDLANAV